MNYHGYYNELRHTYGPNFVEDIKQWKKLGITLERRKMQRKFLFNCKTSNVFHLPERPSFLLLLTINNYFPQLYFENNNYFLLEFWKMIEDLLRQVL